MFFPSELSAEGAKRGVETPPEVFCPDDLPRPSRPKAGLGLVVMMMVMVMMMVVMILVVGKLEVGFTADDDCFAR